MVIKINYTSSDVYVSTNVSPVYVVVNYSGTSTGGGVWGQITGTLSDQTDLQTALDDKVPYTGATANVDLGGFSIKPSMVQITGINSGGTGGVLNIKKGNTRVIGGDDVANNISLWAETAAFGFNDWVSGNLRNAKFSLLSITNNATRTYTLPNLDGTLALLSDITPGLTSVGLSMPSAFSVSNSPLTSNGTIAVTGAGTSSQYVRGDGQLANFPTNGGGGSSVNYYLNGSVTQGTFGGVTYYEMSKTPVLGAGTDFTRTNGQGNGYIASFITDAGDPSLLNIPGGNWNLEFYFQSSASGGSPQFYGEVYKVDASNNFTLVASGSTNPEGITNGTTVDQYFTSIPVPQTSLLVTDRLAIRIYVITSGRTITLHTEDGNLCEVLTTFSTGLNALNGLTAQVQYFATGTSGTDFAINSATDTHTFNLPTASATNRGALSSADWSTFSGKVGGSGATGQVAYWNGTSSQTGSNNLFWDAANARLGIGTTSPQSILQVGSYTASGTYAYGTAATFANSWNANRPTIVLISNTNTLTQNKGGGIGFAGGSESAASPYTFAQIKGLKQSSGADYSGYLAFYTTGIDSNAEAEKMRITSVGNLLLQNGGTFTDGGQRLQVQGDAFIKGSGNTSATFGLTVQNSDGTNILNVRNDGAVQIGSQSATQRPYLAGYTAFNEFSVAQTTLGIVTQFSSGSRPDPGILLKNTLNFTFTSNTANYLALLTNYSPTSGTGVYNNFVILPTINQTGGANGITRGLYVQPTLTAAADWRSIEWSNNSGWGLYGAGTANNYLGGNLVIGQTTSALQSGGTGVTIYGASASEIKFLNSTTGTSATDGTALVATGNTFTINNREVGDLTFGTSNAERMRLTAAGRLLLGTTTESTFLLDVNGTARVSGNLTVDTNTLFVDAANDRVGIGTTSPTGTRLDIREDTANSIRWGSTTTQYGFTSHDTNLAIIGSIGASTSIGFWTNSNTERLRITSGGNLLVGTTTDAGYKLDVNGETRIRGSLNLQDVNNNGLINATSASGGRMYINAYLEHNLQIQNSTKFSIASSGAATFSSSVTATNAVFDRVANDSGSILRIGNATTYYDFSRNASTGALSIQGNQTGANNIIIAPTSGNLLVGTTTDGGANQKLQVNGRISAQERIILTDSANAAQIQMLGVATNVIGLQARNPSTSLVTPIAMQTDGGSVIVGTTTDITSSILTLASTTRGFLPPRMTTTQKNAIGTPAAGLQVYDTTLNQMSYYNGTTWVNF
jgi:hypothetical protein